MYEFNWSDAIQLGIKAANERKDKKSAERLAKLLKNKTTENDVDRSFVMRWYFKSFEPKD